MHLSFTAFASQSCGYLENGLGYGQFVARSSYEWLCARI